MHVEQEPQLIRQPRSYAELSEALSSPALLAVVWSGTKGNLNLCGQCCVAMACNTTLQEAIIATGNGGATTSADLMVGIKLLGQKCEWRRFSKSNIPDACIIRMASNFSDSSHWLYKYHDALYNPAAPSVYKWEERMVTSSVSYTPRSWIEIL